ncbi:hypothetical protein BH24DEI1_BH24DEI1_01940 [soil metagenome]|jgi:hypothetical protein|nr:hypothetical protein [Deinococcota bacterium]
MGKNKSLRKKIQGELEVIDRHFKLIAEELEKTYPDQRAIAKWEKDVRNHFNTLDKLRAKLPGGKR